MIDLLDRLRTFLLPAALLAISFMVMANANRPLMRGLRAQTLKIVGAVEYRISWVAEIPRSLRENQQLRDANLRLTNELNRLRIAGRENEDLREALGWKRRNEFETIAARIIARQPFGLSNFFTLDVGRAQGVDMDMAVISHMGILGRVVQVSQNYSEVMPYLHSQFYVPVMIDTLGAVGIVSGQTSSPDSLILSNVVKTENLQIGQRVITHDASEIFPPNIPVGTITEYRARPGSNFWEVRIEPAAPLHTIHFAFVVLGHSGQAQTTAETLSDPP